MRYWYRHRRRACWCAHAQANTPRKLSTATTTHSPPPQPPRPPQHRRPGAAQACACRSLASSGRSSCALPTRRSLHERASRQQHDATTAAHSSHGHTLGDGGGGGGGPLIRGSSGLPSSKLQPQKTNGGPRTPSSPQVAAGAAVRGTEAPRIATRQLQRWASASRAILRGERCLERADGGGEWHASVRLAAVAESVVLKQAAAVDGLDPSLLAPGARHPVRPVGCGIGPWTAV